MRKLFIMILIVSFSLTSCFSLRNASSDRIGQGPFGLEMGWTYNEVRKSVVSISGEEGGKLFFVEPAAPHDAFYTYIVFIDEEYGLYYISASGGYPLGTAGMLIDKFNELKRQLSQTYGDPQWADEVESSGKSYLAIKDEIESGEKGLYASWDADDFNMSIFLHTYISENDGSLNFSLSYSSYDSDMIREAQEERAGAVL